MSGSTGGSSHGSVINNPIQCLHFSGEKVVEKKFKFPNKAKTIWHTKIKQW